jgi:plasmid maintenance system antidote protein VapI
MAKLTLWRFIPKNQKIKFRFSFNKIPLINKKIKKGEIGIWYELKTPTNGRVIHYQILPKFLKEDEKLYETIGLYFAEGGMNSPHLLNFSNDEPEVINTFLKCFKKYFGISFKSWSWSICFNEKLKRRENKKMTKEREKAAINFWLKKTKIKPEITKKVICQYSNKKAKGKLRTKRKWGSLTLVLGSRILKAIWINIMEGLIEKTIKERNKNWAASILRGWVAGDGYCRFDRYKKIRRELGIVCANKKNYQRVNDLFKIIGIHPSKRKKELSVVKAEYLVKAFKFRLTSLHSLKHLNLLKSLSSYKKRIPLAVKKLNLKEIKKEINLLEKKIKTREELFEKLKRKETPQLKENLNWQFLINGFVLHKGGSYEKIAKEIGCPKTTLINWVKKGKRPSRKYRQKILEKIKDTKKEKLIKLGEFFLKGNWPALLEGLQIFLKLSRRELAQKLKVHPNTIESLINQREKIGKKVASKVFNLIEKYEKMPEEICQIYKEAESTDWVKKIEEILHENKWSQRELAEKLGCSRSLVKEWIRGLKPSHKYKGKLIEIHNIPWANFTIF